MPNRSPNWLKQLFKRRQPTAPLRRAPQLGVEHLEDRTVPAMTITIQEAAGTLDGLLSATDGTINLSDMSGQNGTLSRAALQGVGAGIQISITAENNILFDASLAGPIALQTNSTTNAQFLAVNGSLTFAVGKSVTTNAADITFASTNGTLTLGSVSTAGGNINLVSDAVTVLAGAAVNAGTNATRSIVTVRPTTNTVNINLGGADSAGTLGLTDTELDTISARVLRVGIGSTAGSIAITAPVSLASGAVATLALTTGNTTATAITQTASLSVTNLAVQSVGSVVLTTAGNEITTLAASVTGTTSSFDYADTTGFQLGVVDSITGVTVSTATATNRIGLGTGGALTQAAGANVTGPQLQLLGTGSAALGNVGNNAATLAAALGGTLSYTDADALSIDTVNGTNGVSTTNAAVSISTVNGALTVANTAAATDVNAGTATVTLNVGSGAGVDNALALAAGASVAGTGGVTLIADNMTFAAAAAVNAGSATATLRPFTNGTLIALGGADAANTLGLDDPELDGVTAGIIHVGDANSGTISVAAQISPMNANQLELVTGGAVVDNNVTDPDITVARLAITAGTGVGAGGGNTVLEIVVNNVEVATTSGGVLLSNSGALTVGGVSMGMTGISSGGGTISVTAAGAGTVNDLTVAEAISNTGGGDIILTNQDPDSAVTLAINAPVSTTGGNGNISVNAEDDLNIAAAVSAVGTGTITLRADNPTNGTTDGSFVNSANITSQAGAITILGADVTTAGVISSTAGGSISITAANAVGDLLVASAVTTSGGNGNIVLISQDDITITGAVSVAGTGTITATADADMSQAGNFSNVATLTTAGGDITITGADIDLSAAVTTTTAPGADVFLLASTPAAVINLGNNIGFGLTGTDLNNVTTATLHIGNATNTGGIAVTNQITLGANVPTLSLETGGAISDGSSGQQTDITVTNLALRAGTGIGSADDLEISVTKLAFSNTTSGNVAINNARALTVDSVAGLTASSNAGSGQTTVTVSATTGSAALTFAVNTTSVGNATYTAGEISDSPTFGDNLVVSTGVTVSVSGGSLTLRAGDDVILPTGSTASTSGALTLAAGAGDTDNGGRLTLDGTLVGDPLSLSAINDIVVGTITAGTVTITSTQGAILDGNDGTTAGTLNITATTITLNANKGIGVTNAMSPAINATQAPIEVNAATLIVMNSGTGVAGDINVVDTTGGVTVSGSNAATAGLINLTTLGGGTLTVAPTNLTSTNGNIVLTTDDIAFAGGGTVNSGTAVTTLQQQSDAFGLIVGTTGTNALIIANAELGQITAGVLRLGRTSATGNLTVDEAITAHAGFSTLSLRSGGTVSQNAPITVGTAGAGSLAVTAVGAVTLTGLNTVATFAASVTGSGNALSYTDSDDLTIGTVDGVTGASTTNGALTVTAQAGNLTVSDTAAASDISAGSGAISLTAGSGITHTFTNSAGAVIAGTGDIVVVANNVTLTATSQVTTTGTVELRPNAGVAIDIGGADSAGTPTLGLTSAELNTVTAGVLSIGASDSGPIAVTAAIAPTGTSTLRLRTGGGITQTAGSTITETNLRLQAGAAVALTEANDVDRLAAAVTGAGLSFTDTDDLTVSTVNTVSGITAGGNVDVTAGTSLTLSQAVAAGSGAVTLTATNGALAVGASVSGGGTITLTATDAAVGSQNVTVAAGATISTTGTTTAISAGDTVTINGTLTTAASGTVTVTVDPGSADPGFGGAVTFTATATVTNATSVIVTGGADGDTFNLKPLPTPTTVTVNGAAGTDTLNISLTGATTSAFGSITAAGTGTFTFGNRGNLAVTDIDAIAATGGTYSVDFGLQAAGFQDGNPSPDVTTVSSTGTALTVTVQGNSTGTAQTLFSGRSGDVSTLTVTGSTDRDTVTVDLTNPMPAVTVVGGTPTTAPGDTLNLIPTNATGITFTPTGGGGIYTFANRGTLTFSQIEVAPLTIVSVTASDANAAEGVTPDTGTFTFTRIGDTSTALTVAYTLAGTAVNGQTYQTLSGTVTFAPGAATATVTLTPLDNSTVDGTRTAVLLLTPSASYNTATGLTSATVNIADNDTVGRRVVVGSSAAGTVQVFDNNGTTPVASFLPYAGYQGGVTVAVGDVTGDGVPDIVTGATALSPHVKVFDGVTFREIGSFFAFTNFASGVNVAVGDLDNDGKAEIIVGAGTLAPHIKVFDATTFQERASFYAFTTAGGAPITSGVTVAAADTDGDGKAEIIVGATVAPHVKTFDVAGNTLSSFLVPNLPPGEGVSVGTGDIDGDKIAEILVGGRVGGQVVVTVFKGSGAFGQFSAGAVAGTPGVAGADRNGDGKDELILTLGPTVSVRSGTPPFDPISALNPFAGFTGEVFVG